jgi:hypothetical protein
VACAFRIGFGPIARDDLHPRVREKRSGCPAACGGGE